MSRRGPASPLVTAQPPPCAACGERLAPFGIGPPLVETQQWYCAVDYLFQPATQAALAERCKEALQESV